MSLRQMLPFLLLNILVSAAVVLGILFWWEGRDASGPDNQPIATTIAQAVPAVPTLDPAAEAVAIEAAAVPVAEEAPADEPIVHVVQPGETLRAISDSFDVSMDDIVAANGLANPDLLSVGQQLIIPIGGLPEPTVAAPVEEPTAALPTPIPTVPGEAPGAASDIGISAVSGTGDLPTEVIQIVNNGVDAQSIAGWTLRDEDNNVYTFGQVSIFGAGAGVNLHTRAGDDTVTDLFWGLAEPAWRSGEQVTVWNAANEVMTTFDIP